MTAFQPKLLAESSQRQQQQRIPATWETSQHQVEAEHCGHNDTVIGDIEMSQDFVAHFTLFIVRQTSAETL